MTQVNASVSIINLDDGGGFVVQDLVNEESDVKISVDFSGPGAVSTIIVRGPRGLARHCFEKVCLLIHDATTHVTSARQQLPEKLTQQINVDSTDGSLHFTLDVDEQQVQRELYPDPSLDDIRNSRHHASQRGDTHTAVDEASSDVSNIAETEDDDEEEDSLEAADTATRRIHQVANTSVISPRQHGGAKITSTKLSKVLRKLRAHSYQLGGVNMTAEFERADTSGTG